MSLFKRFVQVGRVVVGSTGDIFDKPAVIVDIIDLNRVLIEGPTSGVKRQVVTLKRVQLTDFVAELKRGATSAEVKAALQTNDVCAEWKNTTWGKKRAAFHAKRSLNDFERFKVMRAKRIIASATKA